MNIGQRKVQVLPRRGDVSTRRHRIKALRTFSQPCYLYALCHYRLSCRCREFLMLLSFIFRAGVFYFHPVVFKDRITYTRSSYAYYFCVQTMPTSAVEKKLPLIIIASSTKRLGTILPRTDTILRTPCRHLYDLGHFD